MAEVTIKKSKLIPLVNQATNALDKAGADVLAFPVFDQDKALDRIESNLVTIKNALNKMRDL